MPLSHSTCTAYTVVAADGHSYERRMIARWFAHGRVTSPLTGAALPYLALVPNLNLRKLIERAMEEAAGVGAAVAAAGASGSGAGADEKAHNLAWHADRRRRQKTECYGPTTCNECA